MSEPAQSNGEASHEDQTRPSGSGQQAPSTAPRQEGFVLQSQVQFEDLVRRVMSESAPKPPVQRSAAKQGGKRTRKRSPSPVSNCSSSDSSSPERRPSAKRSKKRGHKRNQMRKPSSSNKRRRRESTLSDPWQSDTLESSHSFKEEGELSGDQEMEDEDSRDRLFPTELFPHLLNKIIQTLKLNQSSEEQESQREKPAARFLSPRGISKPAVVPFSQLLSGSA